LGLLTPETFCVVATSFKNSSTAKSIWMGLDFRAAPVMHRTGVDTRSTGTCLLALSPGSLP
jgi:hypothetical protein